jgi:hypothetical protein
MATALHKNLPASERHPIHSYEFLNAAARVANGAYELSDLYRVALQLDNNTPWLLTGVTNPGSTATPTWTLIGSTSVAQDSRLDALAGAVLSGHRLVSYDATARMVYADSTTAENVVGLSLNAAAVNGAVTVALSESEITHAGWSWTPQQPLFLGANGNLSQTAPASGFSVRVGEAITATRIFLRIEPAISL